MSNANLCQVTKNEAYLRKEACNLLVKAGVAGFFSRCLVQALEASRLEEGNCLCADFPCASLFTRCPGSCADPEVTEGRGRHKRGDGDTGGADPGDGGQRSAFYDDTADTRAGSHSQLHDGAVQAKHDAGRFGRERDQVVLLRWAG